MSCMGGFSTRGEGREACQSSVLGGWENLPEGRQLEVVTTLGDGEFSPRPRGEPLSQGLSFPHGASWSHPYNFLKIYYSFEIKSLKH